MPIKVLISLVVGNLHTASIEVLTTRTLHEIITLLECIYILASVSFRINHIGACVEFHGSVSMDVWLSSSCWRSINIREVHCATICGFKAGFSSQLSVFELWTLFEIVFDIWHQRQHVLISLDVSNSVSGDHSVPWVLDVRLLDGCNRDIYHLSSETAFVITLTFCFKKWLIIDLLYIWDHTLTILTLPGHLVAFVHVHTFNLHVLSVNCHLPQLFWLGLPALIMR